MPSTDVAGYDWTAHRAKARQLKAALRDGDLCARGGEPLYRWQLELPTSDPRAIHADHVGTPRAFGGGLPDALTCAHHNASHGASMGNRMRGARRRQAQAPARPPARQLPEW